MAAFRGRVDHRHPAGGDRPEAVAAAVLAAALVAVEGQADRGRSCPHVTDACLASAAAADGKYACDYPVDALYKAANAGLEAKNKAAFDFLSKFQLTTDQQNEIAAMVDSDGKTADAAAKEWVDANPDVVAAWLA